jgi:hypothetical protein
MRKRLMLVGGLAVAAGVLTIGGVAYAAADDRPETRYVQVVEGDSAAPAADEQSQNREDCPEKQGGQGNESNSTAPDTTEQL